MKSIFKSWVKPKPRKTYYEKLKDKRLTLAARKQIDELRDVEFSLKNFYKAKYEPIVSEEEIEEEKKKYEMVNYGVAYLKKYGVFKQKMGAPIRYLTEEEIQVVEENAFLSFNKLADKLRICPATLQKMFTRQPEVEARYKAAQASIIGKSQNKLAEMALNGHYPALKFLLETKAGWVTEPQEKQGSGGGKVPNINIKFISTNRKENEARVISEYEEYEQEGGNK